MMFNKSYLHNDNAVSWDTQNYIFKNYPLPYSYNALEPFIDEKTMRLHHDRHLQTYIDNLNKLLISYPQYQSMTLEELIAAAQTADEPLKTGILRNAGGAYNHFFFFDGLMPRRQMPFGNILSLLNRDFGSAENFKKEFTGAALSVFGSGYAFLVLDGDGNLKIVTTRNQMTPLSAGYKPLLNLDVWEHAYYLKHYNDRAAYINDFFNIINWERLNFMLEN